MTSGVAIYAAVDSGEDFVFKDFNPTAERIDALRKDQVIGKRITEVFPGVREFGLFAVLQKVYKTGNPEYLPVALYKDQRESGWRENWIYKLPNGDIVAIFNDITARKEAEDKLEDARNYLNALFNTISDPIFVKDRQHRMVLANDAECRLAGCSREELIGKTDYDFFPKEQVDVFWRYDETVFNTGQESSNEEQITDPSGAVRTIITKKSLYTDKNGNKFIVGIIRDITERKHAEEEIKKAYEQLKDTQAQLIQAGKMSALGQFASGAAHELNNPLTGVLNNVQLIKMEARGREYFDLDDFKELLDIVENSALRCKRITQSLLDFAHGAKHKFGPVTLDELIEKTSELVTHELRLQNIVLEKDLQPGLPVIQGDFQLLEQVIFGLIVNARWAIEKKSKDGGVITLKTWSGPGGKTVSVSVSDTGIGIPPENLAKLFTPFFTTKDVGEGTGLGLALSYNIIKSHKGEMSVESRVGAGTTVTITLPSGGTS
ncbi:MAG: PAS domain S-box protein [Candidatus Omnitrophica bacterium]|nr:PAS domain S-box protein [Candidatus Omnitrophota bacterium]